MYAILCGAPWEGFTVHGPFRTIAEAEQYQNTHLFNQDFWWVIPMARRDHDDRSDASEH